MTADAPPRSTHRDRSGVALFSYVPGTDDERPAAFDVRAMSSAAEDGVAEVGLSVSTANPAQAGYLRLGFQVTDSLNTVVVPGPEPK